MTARRATGVLVAALLLGLPAVGDATGEDDTAPPGLGPSTTVASGVPGLGAAPADLLEIEPADMATTIRAGADAVTGDPILVAPVDHPLVEVRTIRALFEALADGNGIALPLHAERPGHPIALTAAVLAELGQDGRGRRC